MSIPTTTTPCFHTPPTQPRGCKRGRGDAPPASVFSSAQRASGAARESILPQPTGTGGPETSPRRLYREGGNAGLCRPGDAPLLPPRPRSPDPSLTRPFTHLPRLVRPGRRRAPRFPLPGHAPPSHWPRHTLRGSHWSAPSAVTPPRHAHRRRLRRRRFPSGPRG